MRATMARRDGALACRGSACGPPRYEPVIAARGLTLSARFPAIRTKDPAIRAGVPQMRQPYTNSPATARTTRSRLPLATPARLLATPPVYSPRGSLGLANSGHAELVALRVKQHDGVTPHVLVHPSDAGARVHQLLHLLADQLLALLAGDLAVGHPDIEVDPVLGGLALGHALEVDPGTLVRWVDHRRLVAELLFRHPDRPAEILPGLEAVRR